MRVIIEEDYALMSAKGAYEIARDITAFKPEPKKAFFVLGLATGSTPIQIYEGLVGMNRSGKLNFSKSRQEFVMV